MAHVVKFVQVRENGVWPEGVPFDPRYLLLVQSPDGTTGVDVWYLKEIEAAEDL